MASARTAGRVLLISSYHPGFPTFFQQIEGIKSVFLTRSIVFDVEFMDSKRFYDKTNLDNFHDSLSYKLSKVPAYDLILTADDNALSFAIEHQVKLFAELPIIFFGVNNTEIALEQNSNPKVTGVVEVVSMFDTLQLIQKLHPDTKNITALVDSTPSGQGDLKTFYSIGAELDYIDLSEISLTNLSFDEFAAQLQQVPKTSNIILLSAYRDKYNKSLLFNESLQLISANLPRPIYHLWYHGMGDGVFGGKLVNHIEQGATAAKMALEVLDGRPVNDIAVRVESPNRYTFDYREMKRFGIDKIDLPEGSTIINGPISFYEGHKNIAWSLLVAFTILIGFVTTLSINIWRRHRTEKELQKNHERLEGVVKERTTELNDSNKALLESEERFRSLSDAAFEGITITKEGIILETNDTICKMLDYRSSELIGKAIPELIPPEERENVKSKILSGYEHPYESRCLRKDGSTFPIEVQAKMFSYKGHQVRVSAVRDISNRKRNEEALKEARAILQAAMDSSQAAIAIADAPDGRLIYVNKAGLFIRGGTEDELVKDIDIDKYVSSWQILHFDGTEYKKDEVPLARAIMYGEICSDEFVLRRPDGEDRIVWANAAPIYDDEGNVKFGVVVFLDITERKKADEERKGLENQLRQAHKMEAINTMAGGFAHKFNNLLGSILAYTDMAKYETPADSAARKDMEKASESAYLAKELVHKIMTFSRHSISFTEIIQPGKLLHEYILHLENKDMLTPDIHIKTDIDHEAKNIRISPMYFDTIIDNICKNALDAMADNGGTLRVNLRNIEIGDETPPQGLEVAPGKYVMLTVTDSGYGIAVENLERIFDPFYTTKEIGKGDGIGLSVVHGLIEKHECTIGVKSELGSGSTFTVCFPAVDSVQS